MQPGGIFFNKSDQRVARFGQFSFLSQLGRRLKFGQTYIRCRRRGNFTALLLFNFDFFLDERVVTEPRRAAEDDQRQQQQNEPLHGCNLPIVRAMNFSPPYYRSKRASALLRLPARKETMPEPTDSTFLHVGPGKMAILTVKFLGNNF